MEILLFKFFAVAACSKSISAAIAYQRVEAASGRDADRFDADIAGQRAADPPRRGQPPSKRRENPAARGIATSCAGRSAERRKRPRRVVEIRSPRLGSSRSAVVFGTRRKRCALLPTGRVVP